MFGGGPTKCMSSLQDPPRSVGFDGVRARQWVVWGDTGMPWWDVNDLLVSKKKVQIVLRTNAKTVRRAQRNSGQEIMRKRINRRRKYKYDFFGEFVSQVVG